MIELIAERLPPLVILWLSLATHEWAHAAAAYALGDDTARAQGRMSLDPFVHLDPVGTLALPILGVPFGWAIPVPINPAAFDRRWPMSLGVLLTAAAGPLANAVLAGVAWLGLWVVGHTLGDSTLGGVAARLGEAALRLNVALAIFNLLPIPPLDGSRIVAHFLPRSVQGAWEQLERYGRWLPLSVLVVLVLLGVVPIG